MKNSGLIPTLATSVGICASLAGIRTACAQEATTPTLAEIVVTANKREQRLSNVGMSVDVVTGAQLKERQVNSLEDLAQTVPGLSYSQTQSGSPVFTLRGVGFNDTTLAAYPTVTMYLDQAPLPFSALQKHSAFDLQRVEVLEGPQGTLFGENSTGGAINLIPNQPTDTLSAGVDTTYGRFNELNTEGFVSGPLGDQLDGRIAVRVERMDGWQVSNSRGHGGVGDINYDNGFPNDADPTNGSVDNVMGRVILNYRPADWARIQLDINGWNDQTQTEAGQFSGLKVQQPGYADPLVLDTPFSPQNDRAADWVPGIPHANNTLEQVTLRGDFNLAPSLILTSLTDYVHYEQNQGLDNDGLPVPMNDFPWDNGKIRYLYQELRLSNGSDERLRWIAGANVEHTDEYENQFDTYFDDSTTRLYAALYGYPIRTATETNYQEMANGAAFGNLDFDLTSKVTLTGGLRYTRTHNDDSICGHDAAMPNDTGAFIFDVDGFGTYTTKDCFTTNSLGYTLHGVAPGQPGWFVDALNEHNVSWQGGVNFKPVDNMLLYANIKKGYKAGNFPLTASSNFTQYLPVKQESILAYEVGIKQSLLNNRLQFDGAAFYYDYRNKQLRTKLLTPLYGILDVVQNIPKSSIKGVELQARAIPVVGLTVSLDYTYLDATIDEYSGINAAGLGPTNFAGTRMPFTPKNQVGLDAEQSFALRGSLRGFVGVGYTYRSSTTTVVGGDTNPPDSLPVGRILYEIDSYGLLDARFGIENPDKNWRLSVWGKNITDKYYWNNVTQDIDGVTRFAGMPAMFGVTFDYSF